MPVHRFVYGPVPSRRLGRSLGIDLVPFKVCSYDCAYCQLGPTRRLTTKREPFVPVQVLVEQLREALATKAMPDVVTLAGSGEPTLYAPLGELIAAVKAVTSVPVVLLTNGSLFGDAVVRREAAAADIVIPSLDAGDEETFRAVNRPEPSITLEAVVAGLCALRSEFAGSIWLEVMLAAGLNDAVGQVDRIAAQARLIRPDRIHLNTPVRPSPLGAAAVVPADRLAALASRFAPAAEVIAEYRGPAPAQGDEGKRLEQRVLELLERRPCTLEDASQGLASAPNAVLKALHALQTEGRVTRRSHGGADFWVRAQADRRPE